MLSITSINASTYAAINAGHNTNHKLAKFFSTEDKSLTPESMGSRVLRLRKIGLVISHRPNKSNNSIPTTYTTIKKEFIVVDKITKNRLTKKKIKYYKDTGENPFDCLNDFIYPKALATQLTNL